MSDAVPRKFFIVVDPSQDEPLALDRALITAQVVNESAARGGVEQLDIQVFIAVDADNVDTSADNDRVYRDAAWILDRVVKPLQDAGCQFSVEMSWSTEWYDSIIRAARRFGAERIMMPMVRRPSARDLLFGESVWHLLRTAECPVLLVQPGSRPRRNKILAAVNFQSHKPEYQRLNEEILARARWFAENYGAELHFVNAYSDSLHYPDRSALARKTGVENSNIHVRSGDPADVISSVASEIDADVVVLGTRARSSRWRGNTSERIITRVGCDILTVN